MRHLIAILVTIFLTECAWCVEVTDSSTKKGTLVVVGGGTIPDDAIKLFIERAGGKNARLVVIPTATSDARIGDGKDLIALWKRRGAGTVNVLHTRSRETADTPTFVEPLKTATAVWIGGGIQSRISKAYVGTATEQELMALLKRGGVVGGTSAGAAIMTRVMIAGGKDTPKISLGFDFLPGAIVDQHFTERGRRPRLLAALRKHPTVCGFGIDESTALIVQGDSARVIGRSKVIAISPNNLTEPLKVREFAHGARFSIAALRGNAPSQWKPTIRPGLQELRYSDGQYCYVYCSKAAIRDSRTTSILVSVHGYSGRKDDETGRGKAKRAAERWAKAAEKYGWVVVAPHFSESIFRNDYQRLNFGGTRSDIRVNELADGIARSIPGLDASRLHLFGFSGGGQFVHRYVTFNEGRVNRAVAAGAGWYMWPEDKIAYPLGTGPTEELKANVDIRALSAAPLLILVGEDDRDQSSFRRSFGDYDLVALQGAGRHERGKRWHEVLRTKAKANKWAFHVRFQTAPDTDHTISQELKQLAEKFLTMPEDNRPRQ